MLFSLNEFLTNYLVPSLAVNRKMVFSYPFSMKSTCAYCLTCFICFFCRSYSLLNVLEFSSSRKRMSVIVRSEEGTLLLLSKGADRFVIQILP